MRSSVTVSLVAEARGGPFVFWDDLGGACLQSARLGFDSIEVFPCGPDDPALAFLPALLNQHSLRLAAMGTGAGWVKHQLTLTHPDAEISQRARSFVKGIIDQAGALGASAIIGSMQGRTVTGGDRGSALARLIDALDELGDYAARHGVPLLIEPLNRYETNLINTVQDGLDLLALLKTKNLKLLLDLFHMNIEEVSIPAALRAAGSAIGHVHFVDTNRRAPGFGHMDYVPILKALREVGYEGYLSAEVLPWPNSNEAAEQTILKFKELVSSAV